MHGSWLQSQNAELSSIWASSVVLASQKVSTITGIGGVLVAKLRTVVAFGLACCPRISEGRHICVCSVSLFLCFFFVVALYSLGFRALGRYGFKVLEYLGFWISKFEGFQVLGF